MPTDRVLIEIITAANMAGVEQAKAGLLGLNPSTFALGAILGGVVLVGKEAVEVARQHATAENNLQTAIKNRGVDSKAVNDELSDFLAKNLDVVTSQEDVIDATAALVREGVPLLHLHRDLTLILDLAAAKHISVATATDLVTKAEAGQFKGLKDILGLQTEAIGKNQSLADKQGAVNKNIEAAGKATAGAAHDTDALTTATTEMGNHWHDFVVGPGKQLTDALAAGVSIADLFIKMLGSQGFWNALDQNVIAVGLSLKQWLSYIDPILSGIQAIQAIGNSPQSAPGSGSNTNRNPRGGNFAESRPRSVTIHVNAADQDPSVTARAIARQLASV